MEAVSSLLPFISMGGVIVSYLAMVLSLVLQHLLQVQTAGQVALGQVVAELRDAEQTLLCDHCFTVPQNKNVYKCANS